MQIQNDIFNGLEKKLVKVLFFDSEKTRAIKGIFLSSSSDFIKMETLNTEFFISRKNIVKIQRVG